MVGTVSPRLTPIPVTTPIETRHSSLTTTKPMPADAPSPPNMPPDPPPADFSAPSRIRASRFSSDSFAMVSMPKAAKSLRMMG
jgi:hypothetical protein